MEMGTMSLDKTVVAKIAHLARIAVPDDKLDPMADKLNQIIHFIEQLEEVDTDGVEPMSSVVEMNLRQRADIITDGGYADKVLSNAPETEMSFFTVP
jgi:aspartyl-tRNA(Asn)/glutamyl-tRNA(Gln) amidotransferase subunit C